MRMKLVACKVPSCDRPGKVRGMCGMHYQRVHKHGDPGWIRTDYSKAQRPVAERFHKSYEISPEGCWNWVSITDKATGYGRINVTVDGRRFLLRAHRLSFELHKGTIPEGIVPRFTTRQRARHGCEGSRSISAEEASMRLIENSTSTLPIASTYDWQSRPRRTFKRWLFRLLRRPVLP